MELSEPAVVAARAGAPAGADDPFFAGLNSELADKGFIVTAAEDLIKRSKNRTSFRRETLYGFVAKTGISSDPGPGDDAAADAGHQAAAVV